MRAYISRPEHPIGGIIVFQEAFGVNTFIQSVCDRFAAEGYLAIAPELFHRTAGDGFTHPYDAGFDAIRPHLAAMGDAGLEADARAAYDWLTTEGGIAKDGVRSIGFCMGGRVSFLASTVLPLKRAACFYGSNIDKMLDRLPKVNTPLLFAWGGKDTHILPANRRATLDALDEARKSYVNVEFSDADHGFFCDQRSSYHERSAKIVWPMALEFLK